MAIDFATALENDLRILVNLDLEVDDSIGCMLDYCSGEAVMYGVISTPCGCPQPLCLPHYDREKPTWVYGDPIHCYNCPIHADNGGRFIRWEKIK